MNEEVEPHEGHPPARSPSSPSDPWSIWFSRLVQVTGLGIMVYETGVERIDRPWLLLCSMSMLLGGVGLQAIIRWGIGRGMGSVE